MNFFRLISKLLKKQKKPLPASENQDNNKLICMYCGSYEVYTDEAPHYNYDLKETIQDFRCCNCNRWLIAVFTLSVSHILLPMKSRTSILETNKLWNDSPDPLSFDYLKVLDDLQKVGGPGRKESEELND